MRFSSSDKPCKKPAESHCQTVILVMKFFLKKIATSPSIMNAFLIKSLFAFFIFISLTSNPARAQAGFFSAISAVFSDQVSAKVEEPSNVNLQNMKLLHAAVNQDPNPNRSYMLIPVSNNALVAEISPSATITDVDNETNTQIGTYVVRAGDTLSKIADLYNVSVNTIIWANDLGAKPVIRQGETLVILPITGVKHKVAKGETLLGIVGKYKADLNDVLQYNNISLNDVINQGDILIIPDGELLAPVRSTAKAKIILGINPLHDAGGPDYPGYYIRPITGGIRSQGLHGYNAIDFANVIGTPIYASAAGTIIASMTGGWNGGYGNYVVIGHANGTQTLYAPNRENLVLPGEEVSQGQIIRRMGSTGKSTGTHVHFEVRGAQNPF